MENISYHKWATTIVMNCLCRASNSRSQNIYIVLNSALNSNENCHGSEGSLVA